MFVPERKEDRAAVEVARRDIAAALIGYPVYSPPHRQSANANRLYEAEPQAIETSRAFYRRSDENFEYFLRVKENRVEALFSFFAKLGVEASLDDAGLLAVSHWCPLNSGCITDDLRNKQLHDAFYCLSKPWANEFAGLNVIFDLGIFLGECVIRRSKKPRYWFFRAGASDDGNANHAGYDVRRNWGMRNWFAAMDEAYRRCQFAQHGLLADFKTAGNSPDALLGTVKDFATR